MAMGMSGDNRSEQEVQEERVMNQTSIDEARRRASLGDFKRVPITRELLSDIRTPVETLKALMMYQSTVSCSKAVRTQDDGADIHFLDMTLLWNSPVRIMN